MTIDGIKNKWINEYMSYEQVTNNFKQHYTD